MYKNTLKALQTLENEEQILVPRFITIKFYNSFFFFLNSYTSYRAYWFSLRVSWKIIGNVGAFIYFLVYDALLTFDCLTEFFYKHPPIFSRTHTSLGLLNTVMCEYLYVNRCVPVNQGAKLLNSGAKSELAQSRRTGYAWQNLLQNAGCRAATIN